MNDTQIEFLSIRIYDTYPLKVTDLTLFFRNIKEGVYGEFYENLSADKIMGWLGKYFDQRCEYAQMQSQSSHDTFRKDKMTQEEKEIFNENMGNIFRGVGKEKVVYDSDKGLARHKNALYVTMMKKTDYELKKYLLENDSKSSSFDEAMYGFVEQEIEIRNKRK